MDDERFIALAEVARPHGVRGELKIRVYNPDSDLLLRQRRVRVVSPGGEVRTLEMRRPRTLPGGDLIARLSGVDDRDAAEAMRGWRLEVPRELLAPPDGDDEFYVVDLQGCDAVMNGERLGTVVEVLKYPTCDVFVIDRDGNRKNRLEVPFLGAYVGEVDPKGRRIEILTLEGLT